VCPTTVRIVFWNPEDSLISPDYCMMLKYFFREPVVFQTKDLSV